MAEEAQVVEASDEIKFSEEELKELGELQTSYQEKQAALGQIAVQKIDPQSGVFTPIPQEEAPAEESPEG